MMSANARLFYELSKFDGEDDDFLECTLADFYASCDLNAILYSFVDEPEQMNFIFND